MHPVTKPFPGVQYGSVLEALILSCDNFFAINYVEENRVSFKGQD